ncbi:MAG: GrpB family protein [Jannaschia sp.]
MIGTGDGLGLRQGALALAPYDPRWIAAFAALRDDVLPRLPPGTRLHHIGSTAIPGLAAKPILDIALTAPVATHSRIAEVLAASDWIPRGERSGLLFIRVRDGDLRMHNLHLYPPDSPDLADQIAFRDRLRADPDLRDAYAAAKQALIADGIARRDYAAAKTPFIAAALA